MSVVVLLLRYGEQRCALDRLGDQLGVRLRNGEDAVSLGMRVVGARQPAQVALTRSASCFGQGGVVGSATCVS